MNPKLFISYSWSNEEHKKSVLKIARDLRSQGIDALLDVWDLKEGHDKYAFMEKMVSDPEIKKVAIICDKSYAEKANIRKGGVGTETQIITSEIYRKNDQSKFVAIVVEKNDDGTPCIPNYYKSRLHIDLTDPSTLSSELERLVRWAHDRPLHKKPELGPIPKYLQEDSQTVHLATSARFDRAIEAVRNLREFSKPAVKEYFDLFADEFEKLRIPYKIANWEDDLLKSIDGFISYRNEAISMFSAIAIYLDDSETRDIVHRFFEKLIPYLDLPNHTAGSNKNGQDNFKFIVHELYLYAVACYIKHERFESVASLMNDFYHPNSTQNRRSPMVRFTVMRHYLFSLADRQKRLGRNSIQADLLKDRCIGIPLTFSDIMQADFVLYMHEAIASPGERGWFPDTLVYAVEYFGSFEIFARSQSRAYFEKIKIILGIERKDGIATFLASIRDGNHKLPEWDFESFSPEQLIAFSDLATKP